MKSPISMLKIIVIKSTFQTLKIMKIGIYLNFGCCIKNPSTQVSCEAIFQTFHKCGCQLKRSFHDDDDASPKNRYFATKSLFKIWST